MVFSDDEDKPYLFGKAKLTGETKRLTLFGLNLWHSGYSDFNLVDGLGAWDEDNFNVFIQAVE